MTSPNLNAAIHSNFAGGVNEQSSQQIFRSDVSEEESRPVESVHTCSSEYSLSSVSEQDEVDNARQNNQNTPNFKEQIRTLALEHNVTHRAVDHILKILHPHHETLPLCARTLLRTPRSFSVEEICGGKYIHIGLKHNLEMLLETAAKYPGVRKIALNFNIDGLPIRNNSTNNSLWPILGMIRYEERQKPFCIGLYLGQSKPNSIRSYLEPFIEEFKSMSQSSFDISGQQYIIDVKKCLFICDTPARAFLKGILGHNSTYGCDKCTVKGTWLSQHRKTVFLSTTAPLRTDESFRLRKQEEHHQSEFQDCVTLIEELQVDMIKQFPSDYMHLACLGVTRRLCSLWKSGRNTVRQGTHQLQRISALISESVKLLPSEFSRKTRAIMHSERWKATECRLFLLYLGPIVLKNVIPDPLYKHFLLLACSMLILTSNNKTKYSKAREYLKRFVEEFPKLYGEECMTYNAHSILHLIEDVEEHGPVDSFSCFPFENHLAAIKRLVRAPNHTLQQIYARLMELENAQMPSEGDVRIELTREHRNGPTCSFNCSDVKQYSSVNFPNFMLCLNQKDCYFSSRGKIYKLRNILDRNGDIFLLGQPLRISPKFFEYPCNSADIGIFEVTENSVEIEVLNHLVTKCALIVVNNTSICVQLRHLS